MKKNAFFVSAFLFLQFSVCGQFWMHNLPTGPEGEAYNDTLLNKREVIKKEHIKKVTVYKKAPEGNEKAELIRAIYFNESGNIKYKEFWAPKTKDRASFVFDLDTFYYNNSGYRDSIVFTNKPLNAKPEIFCISKAVNDTTIKTVNFGFSPIVKTDSFKQSPPALYSQYEGFDGHIVKTMYDSSFYFTYFNKKGQMVKSNTINSKGDTTAQYFYTYQEDGLLNTIYYSNTGFKDVFVRREIDEKKLVILNYVTANLEWFYNKRGQCINFIFYPNPFQQSVYTNTSFKYNSNGTVAIVTIKENGSNKKAIKYFYSYSK